MQLLLDGYCRESYTQTSMNPGSLEVECLTSVYLSFGSGLIAGLLFHIRFKSENGEIPNPTGK